MEVRINGDDAGPAIRFRIGVIALVQVLVSVATFAAAMKVAQADIERLQESSRRFEQKVDEMLSTQKRMEATMEAMREEIRYYREKLDRHIEQQRPIGSFPLRIPQQEIPEMESTTKKLEAKR